MPRKSPLDAREAEICSRLRVFRNHLGLSQIAFAKKANVDSSVIVRIEHGRSPLRFGIFRLLWKHYELNANWLALGGDREMQAPGYWDFPETSERELFSSVYDRATSKLDERSFANNVAKDIIGDLEAFIAKRKRAPDLLDLNIWNQLIQGFRKLNALEKEIAAKRNPLSAPVKEDAAIETKMFRLIGEGLTDKQIAARLSLSAKEMREHRTRIVSKIASGEMASSQSVKQPASKK